ncbi:MAG: fibronectin type III domain-containing protein [Candidatus Acidiferrales bacterium]
MRSSRTLRRMLAVFLAITLALVLAGPRLWAIPFSQTRIIIEVNATDGDAGIQIFLDAEGWTRLEVFDPNGQQILDFSANGSVEQQGITELFFESAEPSFEEQTLDELFLLFPAGMYKFEATTDEGKKLSGKATLTHLIPAGPELVSPEEGAVVNPALPVVISWEPVTDSFPGTQPGVNVVAYQVIVEQVKPKSVRVFSITLPATTTQATVPPELFQTNAEYKFEVLAIEASGNQTISESTFKTQ